MSFHEATRAFKVARIQPFILKVPEAQLTELRDRLNRVRWPEQETVGNTSQGPQKRKVQALVEHWRSRYDWRRCEGELNGFGQFKTVIDGVGVHFLHVRSPEPNALPLLMCHGWPGSVLEFRKVIGPLTNPAAHGAKTRQAFHVIAPSMPGFGFSDKPEAGWGIPQIAGAWIDLIARLGYERWALQGGDIGAGICDAIARKQPRGLVGMHLNFAMFKTTPEEAKDATPEEQAMLKSAGHFWDQLSGYAKVQSTRPQTIGYSLADSPTGLAAWIYAMFQDTCGTPGDAEASFTLDEMLDDIMLYWLPNTGASSARIYWEMTQAGGPGGGQPAGPIQLPSGFTMLAREAVRKSRRCVERRYANVVHFNEFADGGHFAALEQPDVMVSDIRATFDALR
jgi:pimeloyl-ACP methyl ester carboxylesterase